MDRASRKILKSPSAKRRSRAVPINQRVTLERVLGLTASSNAALSCDPHTGTIAYPAGCVIVLFNPRRNRQSHIFNFSKKTLTAVAFSGDGKHLVSGESGHQPAVRVWDVEEKTQVAEFHGHKFGINCVAFSPNLKYIVSIGSQHDMMVNLWNWRSGSKVASNKVSSKVSAVGFADDGSYFVTVGNRHVKFWYLDTCKSKIKETVPLLGRSGIIGDQKNNFFCDIVCGKGKQCKSTYVITQSGRLCQFNEKRLIDKWVELRATSATGLAASEEYIYIGCGDGIVRVFDAHSLHFITTLPFPHCLGVDVSTALSASVMVSNKKDVKYPDTVALAYDEAHKKITCIYNDHSLYIWDVHDIRKVGKAWSFLYHSSCIWGLEVYPSNVEGGSCALPTGSFMTCSSDDTIRVWNLDPHMMETDYYKKNIYSHELLKIHYIDPNLTSLRDVDYNPAGSADKTDTNFGGKNGVKSIRVSPDGQHLASGDRTGNIRIHDIRTLNDIKLIEAHDAEVLCLEYSSVKTGPRLLATASRDRLLHVFDVEQNYGLLQTLDDHSSSITAVKFVDNDEQLKMLSCGADKSVLFRNAQLTPDFQFGLSQHLVGKTTLYDMDVDPTQKFVITACQDRNVRIYNIQTAKQKKNYKGSVSDDGVLIKIQLDPSGSYAATSCTDKNICLLDVCTGEIIATIYGHSEMATGLKFMNDFKHLISVSGDGCIFIWRLPGELTSTMKSRAEQIGKLPTGSMVNGNLNSAKKDLSYMPTPVMIDLADGRADDPVRDTTVSPREDAFLALQDFDMKTTSNILDDLNKKDPLMKQDSHDSTDSKDSKSSLDYRFSIGSLPKWAKGKTGSGTSPGSEENNNSIQPKGRWAQRVDNTNSLLVMSETEERDLDQRRFTFEPNSFQNESVENLRRETMVLDKSEMTPKKIPIIIDDESNNDDDDDDFFPSFHTLDGSSSQNSSESDSKSEGRKWSNRRSLIFDRSQSFDLDEGDDLDSTSEVIYFPRQSGDTSASSFQVFAVDGNNKAKTTGSDKNQDAASESTDTISIDDMDDDEDSQNSNPATPMEEMTPKTPDREKFLRDAFENMSFTPISTEKFTQRLDDIEGKFGENPETPLSERINQRLSLSARFISRAQQANIKNMAVYNSIQRQDNWFDSLQRQKDEMARAVDETRKRFLAMGWKSHSPDEAEKDVNTVTVTSPLTPHRLDFDDEEKTPTNLAHFSTFTDSTTGILSPKSLRYCWSALALPKQPIPEEKAPEPPSQKKPHVHFVKKFGRKIFTPPKIFIINNFKPLPKPVVDKQSEKNEKNSKLSYEKNSSRIGNEKPASKLTNGKELSKTANENQRSKIPSPRKYSSPKHSARNHIKNDNQVSLNDSQKTPTGTRSTPLSPRSSQKSSVTSPKSSRPHSLHLNKAESDQVPKTAKPGTARVSQSSMHKKQTESLKSKSDPPKNRLSKSSSTSSLLKKDDSTKNSYSASRTTSIYNLESKKEQSRPKEKLSAQRKMLYASVPNLATCLEESEEEQVTNLTSCVDLSKSSPDINVESKKNRGRKGESRNSRDASSLTKRRSSSTSSSSQLKEYKQKPCLSLPPDSVEKLSEPKTRGSWNKIPDKGSRQLMPPPMSVSVAKTNKHDSFVKKAVQSKRRSTSDLTLDQAKDILLGRSGILGPSSISNAEKSRSSSSLNDSLAFNLSDTFPPNSTFPSEIDNRDYSKGRNMNNTSLDVDPTFFSVATEIENVAAEMRCQNIPSKNDLQQQSISLSELDASPNDLPEKDMPTSAASMFRTSTRSQNPHAWNMSRNDKMTINKSSTQIDDKHSRKGLSRSKTPTRLNTVESKNSRRTSDTSENRGRSSRSKTPTNFVSLESLDKSSNKVSVVSERRGSSARSKTPTSFGSPPQPVPLVDDGEEAGSSPSVRERIATLRKNLETRSSSPGPMSPRSTSRSHSPGRSTVSNFSLPSSHISTETTIKDNSQHLAARSSSPADFLDDTMGFDSHADINRRISAITSDFSINQEQSDKSLPLTGQTSTSGLETSSKMSPAITIVTSSKHQFSSSTPADKTSPELQQTCLDAVTELKNAVNGVTQLYEEVMSQSDEQSSKISRMLQQSVQENQTTLGNFMSKHNWSDTACVLSTPSLLDSPSGKKESADSSMQTVSQTNDLLQATSPLSQSSSEQEIITQAMSLVEPMMEKYANNLSDRLLEMLSKKLGQSLP
ncbi:hypothetical protein ScPMuIL_014554 [Solemya velum]